MGLFLWYTVDGVGCRGGTWRVVWDGFHRRALSFSAKVNKELSYHTICCLWAVTHGFWTAASTLPACPFEWQWSTPQQFFSSPLVNMFKEQQLTNTHCARLRRHTEVHACTQLMCPWACHRGPLPISNLPILPCMSFNSFMLTTWYTLHLDCQISSFLHHFTLYHTANVKKQLYLNFYLPKFCSWLHRLEWIITLMPWSLVRIQSITSVNSCFWATSF